MNNYIIDALTVIQNTYNSILAYFYQRIAQTQFTNNNLATYAIDYTLLLPSSEFIFNLNSSQVSAQMQAYINLCNLLVTYITTNTNTQTTLFYEQIQNTLNTTITALNTFSISLLEAEYASILTYTVPYNMSMTNALFLNNISLDNWQKQVKLNPAIIDFNNILQNTQLNLLRS